MWQRVRTGGKPQKGAASQDGEGTGQPAQEATQSLIRGWGLEARGCSLLFQGCWSFCFKDVRDATGPLCLPSSGPSPGRASSLAANYPNPGFRGGLDVSSTPQSGVQSC